MTEEQRTIRSTKRFLIVIIVSIILGESFIMVLFSYIHPPKFIELFGDSILLSLLVSPVLYFFSYKPLMTEREKVTRIEKVLRGTNVDLEKRIKDRTSELVQLNQEMQLQVSALEAAANGILLSDRNGLIVWINKADLPPI